MPAIHLLVTLQRYGCSSQHYLTIINKYIGICKLSRGECQKELWLRTRVLVWCQSQLSSNRCRRRHTTKKSTRRFEIKEYFALWIYKIIPWELFWAQEPTKAMHHFSCLPPDQRTKGFLKTCGLSKFILDWYYIVTGMKMRWMVCCWCFCLGSSEYLNRSQLADYHYRDPLRVICCD